ncbi:MAG: hypothetical protein Q8T08_08260 [Ignavibacteria bacterium]|nr:hypothetical protein [Ignavibacteria bacterium]
MIKKVQLGLFVLILYTHSSLPCFAMNDSEELKTMVQILPKNSFSEETIQSLKKMMVLRQLPKEMNGHEFVNCGFRDDESQQVSYFLSQASHLTTLNLSGNNFTSVALPYIFEAINLHPRLTELDVSSNALNDQGGKMLLEFMQYKTDIKILKY